MLPIKTILHPTDFSPSSQYAFQMACSLAHEHLGRLVIVHVERVPETVMGEFGLAPPVPIEVERWQKELDKIQPPSSIAVERRLLQGDPVVQILALARDCQADLIVMGTHGHSAMHGLLMGSVAEKVVRGAACPVLTLKVPAK